MMKRSVRSRGANKSATLAAKVRPEAITLQAAPTR
jgi:hypothetical protein